MRWFDLAFAAIFSAFFTAFHFLPGTWCEPAPVRGAAGVFVIPTAIFYLWAVEDRRSKVGAWHRIIVGGATGIIVAAIAGGPGELYALLGLVGGMLGYISFRWLGKLPI